MSHFDVFNIPAFRVRRIKPGRRYSDLEIRRVEGADPMAQGRFKDPIFKSLNRLQIEIGLFGVLRQTGSADRGFETKSAGGICSSAMLLESQKTAMPIPGAGMPQKGGDESGCPDTRDTPLRQNLNGI